MIVLRLPWPPSMNHYWRRVGNRTLISREGREYRERVISLCRQRAYATMTGRLAVMLMASPPDRRRRDLDNLQKPLLDALEHAGVYANDSQIDLLITDRGEEVVAGGCVIVMIDERPERSRVAWWVVRLVRRAMMLSQGLTRAGSDEHGSM